MSNFNKVLIKFLPIAVIAFVIQYQIRNVGNVNNIFGETFLRIIILALPVCYAVFLIHLKMRKAEKTRHNTIDEFIESEQKSNFIRKKEIPESYFITPTLERLPFKDELSESTIDRLQKNVVECSKNKMIKLNKKMDNRELKFEFGTANLELITGYEDNHDKYMFSLINWAKYLIDNDELADAEIILEETICLGSEISKSYTMLGDVYKALGKREKLQLLWDKVTDIDFMRNNISIKYKISDYIEKLLESKSEE